MQLQHQAERKAENFPVITRLLPKTARMQILAFYDYVRGLDNIADATMLPESERERQLQAVSEAVAYGNHTQVPGFAKAYQHLCQQGMINPNHANLLLQAFLRDTRQHRYQDWQALLDYCRYSAAPVGHFLLEVLKEPEADRRDSDALCTLLQILNHLQDARCDYRRLNRIYLPQSMMKECGVVETMLDLPQMNQPVRQLYDTVLQCCQPLLLQARRLPPQIADRRNRHYVAWVVEIAALLLGMLQREDVLDKRVRPRVRHLLYCGSVAWIRY